MAYIVGWPTLSVRLWVSTAGVHVQMPQLCMLHFYFFCVQTAISSGDVCWLPVCTALLLTYDVISLFTTHAYP